MQRELIPELFNEEITPRERPSLPYTTHRQMISGPDLRQEITDLQIKMQLMSQEQVKLQAHVKATEAQGQERSGKIIQHIQKMEQYIQTTLGDFAQKLSGLGSRFAERKSYETKVQEMIDRHNGVLRAFENRLGQLQKILAEKESQITQTQSVIQDLRTEIARLRRLS